MGKVPNRHRNKGTADAGGQKPLTGRCSGLVPSGWAQGGFLGTGPSGAARGDKPSPMAEQGTAAEDPALPPAWGADRHFGGLQIRIEKLELDRLSGNS